MSAGIEKTARTVEEAVALGLGELGLRSDQVRVEILEEPSKGLFGLIGSRQARVRLTPRAVEQPAAQSVPDPMPEPARPVASAPISVSETAQAPAKAKERGDASKRAEAFLGGLLAHMELEAEAKLDVREDEESVTIVIEGPDPAHLIGHRGETLDAIQYLTSLRVNRGQENYTRVHIDTGGYRARREETLVKLGQRMAEKALKTGRRVALEPMNPYERRVLHSSLQTIEGVSTHSEGEEPMRRVIIVPDARQ